LVQGAFRAGTQLWRGPKRPTWLATWRDVPESPLKIPNDPQRGDLDRPWMSSELPQFHGMSASVAAWPGFVEGSLLALFGLLGARRVPGVAVALAREVGPARAFLEFCTAFDLRGGRRASRRELSRAAERMAWLDQEREGAAYLDPTPLRWALLRPAGWPLRWRWRRLQRVQLVRYLRSETAEVSSKLAKLEAE